MVQTHSLAKSKANTQELARGDTRESSSTPTTEPKVSAKATRGKSRKRKPDSSEKLENIARSKKPKHGSKATACLELNKPQKDENIQKENEEPQRTRPRLTTPDLEFDFDRSQLRDPRPTPGRKARPQWCKIDAPQEIKDWVEATFKIPQPEKPKGRLDSFQKDEGFRDMCRLNPFESFHHLYKCHDKGPNGSPTYNEGGYELDWDKVDNWMNPRPYNKRKVMRAMDKSVAKGQTEDEQIESLFFLEGHGSHRNIRITVMEYLKDKVSKDIGVPFHQIGPGQVRQWREKGFELVKFQDWWKEPTQVEKDKSLKLLCGSRLRKNL